MKLVLTVCALICFILKAFAVPVGTVDTMNLGFAFLVAALLA